MSGQVIVCEHNLAWAEEFLVESDRLRAALGQNLLTIHHIGSTAIPLSVAKPVIDMLAEVSELAGVDRRNPEMASLGYQVMGEFGISGRRYFRKGNSAGVRTHHVHVFERGDSQVERHLAFRDYLNAHPEMARQYSALKQRLAQQNPDSMDHYIQGKQDFIRQVDLRAAAWHPAL